MNKIIASAGLLALGLTGVQAAVDRPEMDSASTKDWSISASLRGFYDDNYAIVNDKATDPATGKKLKRDSFGFELSPGAIFNHKGDQTDFGAQYLYSMRFYDDRQNNKADHSHQFDIWLTHHFNQRFSLTVADSFVIAQEPQLIDPSLGTIQRANGNNIRNTGSIGFNAQLTEMLELAFGYQNSFFDYENQLNSAQKSNFPGGGVFPSRSGILDRIEHLANVDLRSRFSPETVGLIGYQFGMDNYTANEPIQIAGGKVLKSNVRDDYSHYAYLGLEHNFNESLTGSIRVGGRYTDYYNTPNSDSSFSPYVSMMTKYTYLPRSYVELGFRHNRNATDQVSSNPSGKSVTTDEESSAVYAILNHRITPKLTGNIIGQYQHSTFNGGATKGAGKVDGQGDDFFIAGANLTYQFNHYFSTEVGYNYDKLESDLKLRGYDRNRVYIGVRATY